MTLSDLDQLSESLCKIRIERRVGQVSRVSTGSVEASGLAVRARLGDGVTIKAARGGTVAGEIVAISPRSATIMTIGAETPLAIGDQVELDPQTGLNPGPHWIGRLIGADGTPLDGRPLAPGPEEVPLRRKPPDAALRKPLGARVSTGLAAMDTLLPLAKGQRVGIFAGSGVGKTTLLAALARGVAADHVVIGLIGERGREVREFVDNVLGEEGMARATVIAATSDQSPLLKRRAAWAATAVAEYYRDTGSHVLLILDSLTRFAEAHREIALTAGEPPSLRAFPPSITNAIAALAERSGPGPSDVGDITAVYSVLVQGSDMDEPVADITRGVLDGHIILERRIAERGRFPAIDIRRSVSRSLPGVASAPENLLIAEARRDLAIYEDAEAMIQAGLYTAGSDPEIDRAIQRWPRLDAFAAKTGLASPDHSFAELSEALGHDEQKTAEEST